MVFDARSHIADLLRAALKVAVPDVPETAIALERPKQAAHGDFACSVAMQLARALKRNPREIATAILGALPDSPWVTKAEIAGAGFINFFVAPGAKHQVVGAILGRGAKFGRSALGAGQKVLVEFVSANPTGPLHVGHGRGAAFGASLSCLLDFAGFAVEREYYVNDAGRQMDILATSTWLRYLEFSGVSIPFPPNAYQGDYVREMARAIRDEHGARYVRTADEVLADVPPMPSAGDFEVDEKAAKARTESHLDGLIASAKANLGDQYAVVFNHALTEQLNDGRDDLAEFGVHFDTWYSEKSLYDSGLVARTLERLEAAGHLYAQDGARWFRSTAFGDEKDRVVQRDNGLYTYFASDIAYHLNKFERGFDRVIDIWGADHHGYIPRVRGALQAMELDVTRFEVALVQFAVLYRNGQKTSMSTRSGEFVTLRELRREVGNDAARFFYVLRKSDQHLDFDLDLAKSQSADNPVYYIQYAHARVCSVVAQWGGAPTELVAVDLGRLAGEREMELCVRLMQFPEVIESSARDFSPHAIAHYLRDLAGEFHAYYNAERILVDDEATRLARLALCVAVRQVLRNGLGILGVSAPETM